jgi:hypothetical protein
MIGDNRADTDLRKILLSVAWIGCCLILSGCGELRTAMGIERVGPDEFAVESRAPLVIPPDFDLRPPQPGAARPQEKTAAEKARSVIDSAGPGEPGKQATAATDLPERAARARTAEAQVDPSQQVGDQSLAKKLLGSNDTSEGPSDVKRQTETLKGVY